MKQESEKYKSKKHFWDKCKDSKKKKNEEKSKDENIIDFKRKRHPKD